MWEWSLCCIVIEKTGSGDRSVLTWDPPVTYFYILNKALLSPRNAGYEEFEMGSAPEHLRVERKSSWLHNYKSAQSHDSPGNVHHNFHLEMKVFKLHVIMKTGRSELKFSSLWRAHVLFYNDGSFSMVSSDSWACQIHNSSSFHDSSSFYLPWIILMEYFLCSKLVSKCLSWLLNFLFPL